MDLNIPFPKCLADWLMQGLLLNYTMESQVVKKRRLGIWNSFKPSKLLNLIYALIYWSSCPNRD